MLPLPITPILVMKRTIRTGAPRVRLTGPRMALPHAPANSRPIRTKAAHHGHGVAYRPRFDDRLEGGDLA
jgi:hypothetical protein